MEKNRTVSNNVHHSSLFTFHSGRNNEFPSSKWRCAISNNSGIRWQTTSKHETLIIPWTFPLVFQPLSSLEKDIAAILQSSNNNIQPDSLLTQAEKKIISQMDLLEVNSLSPPHSE